MSLYRKTFDIKSGVVNVHTTGKSSTVSYVSLVFSSDFAQTDKSALTKVFHERYADHLEWKFGANLSDCFYKPCYQKKPNYVAISWVKGVPTSLSLRYIEL